MTHRALSLLSLKYPSLILDVGCGSGLSGSILSSAPASEGGPHIWVGMDISPSMLDIALQRDVEGDLLLSDIGQGVPFRAGTFDAAISISAVQWLCNAESSDTSPQGRLARFFAGLYASLRRGGRAVCQFYPKNEQQKSMVSTAAIKAGFGAGLLEDGAGTKNAKVYLVLTVGGGELKGGIEGIIHGMEGIEVIEKKKSDKKRGEEKRGRKGWILDKKAKMERRGMVVKRDSKYTGRRRKIAW